MMSRERWLAALRMKPVDRLPFWPKLNGSYPKAQELPFREMPLREIHDYVGSDRHENVACCVREVRTHTSIERSRSNGTIHRVYRTPGGQLTATNQYDGPSDAWHPIEFPVKTLDDIRIMTELYEDITVELDTEALDKARAQVDEIGQDALTVNWIGESPLMNWVEHIAGVENAHFLLMDHRQEVERLFEVMHSVLLERTKLLCENSPADVFYMVENTSTTLISPEQYRTYCARHVGEYAAITSSADRNMILHMCGHLKALLPQLAKIPAQAFESFTTPTLGNTTLLDGRSACPDKCLVGGTNAMLWLKQADEIAAKIEEDLNELPHHRGIVVTSAGVMPPMCRPDTIRQVRARVVEYPVR